MNYRRTDPQFVDYLEDCCRNGAIYGDLFVHLSADDRIRWAKIRGSNWKGGEKPARTTIQSVVVTLKDIAAWRRKTADTVARKLMTGSPN